MRELEREARLADPARAGEREQADVRVGEQLGGGLEVLVAAEQRRRRERAAARRRRGGGAAPARRRVELERRVVGEDRGLQALELAARVEPEVLDQRVAGAPVGLQRVGLAAGAVEREHQLRVQALAVRVLGGQALQLADDRRRGGRARGRARCRCSSASRRAPAIRSASIAAGPEQRRVGQRRAAEQRQRLAQQLGGLAAGAASRACATSVSKRCEVERAGVELDRVAGRAGDDRVRPERAPQLGDVHLQRLGRGRRRVLAPQHVDQPLGRDDVLAVREQQHRQQRPLLGRA